MSQAPENLLESDRLDEVLEDSGPSPVVVVQYGHRARPWLAIVAVTAALTLGGLLAYNWREARRLRLQALQAKRALERVEEARVREIASQPPPDRPVVVAMNPTPADPTEVRPAPAPTVAAPSTPGASGAPPAEKPQAPPAEKPQDPPTAPAASRPESPTSPTPGVLARVPEEAAPTPTPTPSSRPEVPDAPSSAPPADARAPVATTAGIPDSRSPFDELLGSGAESTATARSDAAAAPASAPAPGAFDPQVGAGAAAGRAAEPPLPSREETERQIREEAARAKQETDARVAQQREDLRTLHDEDRRQFLEDLQTILKVHGKRAGPEIERLSQRSGRKEDPTILARARWVIAESKTSQRGKVRQLRALGVSETVILDYLANGLNRKLGARDGPRSPDEVWVQAASLLLKYSRETPRPPRAVEPGGRPTGQPVGSQQSVGDAARPR